MKIWIYLLLMAVLYGCDSSKAGKWSADAKKSITGYCLKAVALDTLRQKQVCDCMIQKLENEYTPEELEKKEKQISQAVEDCFHSLYFSHVKKQPGSKWTLTQKLAFIDRFGKEQSLPEPVRVCVAEKLEQKYSYMELENIPEPEIITMVMGCRK